jgi:hypothetical protein
MRIFPLQSVSAQQYGFGGTMLPSSPPYRFRAGEPSMSPVNAWVRASSPSRRFAGPAVPSCESPPKFYPASVALISRRPDALWKAQWRWLVSLTALRASQREFLRSLRGRIHRPGWRRTFLRAHRAVHVRWFVSLACLIKEIRRRGLFRVYGTSAVAR